MCKQLKMNMFFGRSGAVGAWVTTWKGLNVPQAETAQYFEVIPLALQDVLPAVRWIEVVLVPVVVRVPDLREEGVSPCLLIVVPSGRSAAGAPVAALENGIGRRLEFVIKGALPPEYCEKIPLGHGFR
mgnify:CR=1 FL=1